MSVDFRDLSMRIGLNLLHAHPNIGGGWNYIRNVVSAIDAYDATNEFFAYCTPQSECLVPVGPRFHKIAVPISSHNRALRIAYENTILNLRARRDRIDIMYWFANTCSSRVAHRSLVTVHDLLGLVNPQAYSWLRRQYLRFMLPRTVCRAAMLASVSEKTADDLVQLLGAQREKIAIIRNPLRALWAPAEREAVVALRRRYDLPESMWLYVAHYYPHKNHRRLFNAYRQLRETLPTAWPLVLCGNTNGRHSELAKMLAEAGLTGQVRQLSGLSDNEMPVLYSAASALVFPSLYEGGGIPVMEAMACGCPIVASDIPTTREFAGEAALLFDPHSTDSIFDAMIRFQSDASLRESYRDKGLICAEKLRARYCYQELLKAFQKIQDSARAA